MKGVAFTQGGAIDAAKSSGSSPPVQDRILLFLASSPSGSTEAQLLEAVEGRRQTVIKFLRQLVEEGKVSKQGRGGKSDPFRYRLPECQHDHDTQSSDSSLEPSNSDSSAMTDSSRAAPEKDAEPVPIATPKSSPQNGIYKVYKLPNGELLEVTREQFDRVVNAIRILHEADLRVQREKAADSKRSGCSN